jgi:hypothetical protein
MTCKEICKRYKSQHLLSGGLYRHGIKRCQICEIYIKWEGLWCPCCGYKLRTKPRNKKYKEKTRGDYIGDELGKPITVSSTTLSNNRDA